MSLLSIQYLRQMFRTKRAVRLASCSFSYCYFVPSSFASNTNILTLKSLI
jgi:hypothetical protein